MNAAAAVAVTARGDGPASSGSVAYVLKGYPRLSELFIASEIWRLEQLGVAIRLYVCTPPEETTHHPVVDRVAAIPVRLPAVTSIKSASFTRWCLTNVPAFTACVSSTARRHPRGFARSLAAALRQSWRARTSWRPKAIYAKEWLLATALAAELDRAGDVSHLHAHFAHGTTTVTWLASLITGIPFSFTGHAKDIYRESLNPAGLLARKARAAEFVVTCTGANVAHLRSVAPDAHVELAYHGLNADFASLLADPPPRTTPPMFTIVSVGRMVPKKGFDVLLRAVAELRDRGVSCELIIGGEPGSESRAIELLTGELGLTGCVETTGPQSQAQLLALYRRASVFVLACRVDEDGDRDGIPNVLVEAMAAGLPAVSTAVSGIPELIQSEVNGILVEPDQPSALADALMRLAKDPELASSLATEGTRTVKGCFDGDLLAKRLASLFGAPKSSGQAGCPVDGVQVAPHVAGSRT